MDTNKGCKKGSPDTCPFSAFCLPLPPFAIFAPLVTFARNRPNVPPQPLLCNALPLFARRTRRTQITRRWEAEGRRRRDRFKSPSGALRCNGRPVIVSHRVALVAKVPALFYVHLTGISGLGIIHWFHYLHSSLHEPTPLRRGARFGRQCD